jgi:hypothetical protein
MCVCVCVCVSIYIHLKIYLDSIYIANPHILVCLAHKDQCVCVYIYTLKDLLRFHLHC